MENKCKNCGKCCIKTEMILSQQDIDRIIQNIPKNLKRKNLFFKNQDGIYQLKNTANQCVFLDHSSKKCTIYEYRPRGCKFYPLIYDFTRNKCIFDKDCPRPHLFYQNKENLKTNCYKLRDYLRNQLRIDIDE